MKIALVGNLNNNNLVLMQYLRDLGADARLLRYFNDRQYSASHLVPEADTREMHGWSSFVYKSDMPSPPVAAFDFPFSNLLGKLWATMAQVARLALIAFGKHFDR